MKKPTGHKTIIHHDGYVTLWNPIDKRVECIELTEIPVVLFRTLPPEDQKRIAKKAGWKYELERFHKQDK